MAARAMWKGVIRIDDLSVPVKLYSALEDRKVHFNLLHERDEQPVQQQMIEPSSEEPVPREEIKRGLEVDGQMVVLTSEDLEEATPEPSRDLEVLRCVPLSALDDPWYDRPYWLGPDGDAAPYFAFARALAEEERMAVVRWTMRKKRYRGAVRARGDHLALVRLRYAEEVVPFEALKAPSGRKPDDRELKLAQQLIEALEGDLDIEELTNEYREQLEELIEAKAEGKVVQLPKAKRREEPEGSLMDALNASLKSAKGG